MLIAGCGDDDAPGATGVVPTPDGAAGQAGAQHDAAREAETGAAGGGGSSGTGGGAGASGAAGKGGGTAGTGGGTGGAAGSGGGGGSVDAAAPDVMPDRVENDTAPDAVQPTPDADAASVDVRQTDALAEPTPDAIADAANSVCTPPSSPGNTYDCNSGCKQPTDAPYPTCNTTCQTPADGWLASTPTVSDVSFVFPAIGSGSGCASCTDGTRWSFSITVASQSDVNRPVGCVRVTTSTGRTVTGYESVDVSGRSTATVCRQPADPPASNCVVVAQQVGALATKAIVVRAVDGAPPAWVRIETGPCPLACP